VKSADGSDEVTVEVISSTEDHDVKLLKTVFEFSAIKALLSRPDFSMVYHTMHGVNGPYIKNVLHLSTPTPRSLL
jgi:phosphoglucomutase